jgi:bacteriorhodopsin
MVAFNINRQRLSWLWAQFFLFLGLVFGVVFEKKRCKYINQNKKELIVIDYD